MRWESTARFSWLNAGLRTSLLRATAHPHGSDQRHKHLGFVRKAKIPTMSHGGPWLRAKSGLLPLAVNTTEHLEALEMN